MTVTLNVPDHVSFQLVYRMEKLEPYQIEMGQGLEFVFLNSISRGIRHYSSIVGYCGSFSAAKSLIKLATPRRSMYMVIQEGRTVSAGWCTVGRCRYYKVESNAVVIGPIWTAECARGKGIAVKALQLAVNEQLRRHRSCFYIDTEKKNTAAQRVFEKSGFGSPVALYFR